MDRGKGNTLQHIQTDSTRPDLTSSHLVMTLDRTGPLPPLSLLPLAHLALQQDGVDHLVPDDDFALSFQLVQMRPHALFRREERLLICRLIDEPHEVIQAQGRDASFHLQFLPLLLLPLGLSLLGRGVFILGARGVGLEPSEELALVRPFVRGVPLVFLRQGDEGVDRRSGVRGGPPEDRDDLVFPVLAVRDVCLDVRLGRRGTGDVRAVRRVEDVWLEREQGLERGNVWRASQRRQAE